jgi:hypothetical protein
MPGPADPRLERCCAFAAAACRKRDIDKLYFYHHNMQLDNYAAMRHHASVSSIFLKEIDSARSRSGLFFARDPSWNTLTLFRCRARRPDGFWNSHEY